LIETLLLYMQVQTRRP